MSSVPFYVLKSESIDEGLRRISREQVDIGLRDCADDSLPGHRKVHSMRIRCKKLRGLLRLLEPIMGAAFHAEDQRYKAAARELATAREQEIHAREIVSHGHALPDAQQSAAFDLQPALRRSRDILLICRDTIDSWPVHVQGFYDVAPGFASAYRKCLRAWETACKEPGDENMHRLRRWAKYHWYHIRVFERLHKSKLRKRRRKLRKLQLLLGDAHDLATLEAALERDGNADEKLRKKTARRKNTLYRKALNVGESVFTVSPGELVADLSMSWARRERGSS